MRHPGASSFARSSTVQVKLEVLGETLDFFFKIVRFDANGSVNAFGAHIVVAMTADVDNPNLFATSGSEPGRQFSNLNPWHYV